MILGVHRDCKAVGSPQQVPDPAAKDQGKEQWWLELCTHRQLWGCWLVPAAAGGNCKHTWSGGDQGRQQGPGPTVYALAPAGAQLVPTMAAGTHHQRVAVEPTWDWAKGTQAHIWRG